MKRRIANKVIKSSFHWVCRKYGDGAFEVVSLPKCPVLYFKAHKRLGRTPNLSRLYIQEWTRRVDAYCR